MEKYVAPNFTAEGMHVKRESRNAALKLLLFRSRPKVWLQTPGGVLNKCVPWVKSG